MPDPLTAIVEAILFASSGPLERSRIVALLNEYEADRIDAALRELADRYPPDGPGGFFLDVRGEGDQLRYHFLTRDRYAPWVKRLFSREQLRRLSAAALETLACVAYRQPISRAEVEEIRGVDCSGTLRNLVERGLVRIVGRRSGPGKPVLYGTTRVFLDTFALESLDELPALDEFGVDAGDPSQLPLLNGASPDPE